MRLNRLLPFAAAALLAACNPQTADRSGSARAPIPAAPAPAPEAQSAACPKSPAPACVPEKAKASARAASRGTKVAARRKAVTHKAAVHRVAAQAPRRTYRRYEALAGGPAPHSGYARVPHRDYARVPQDGYPDGPATTYRYGPAYPPAARPDERGYEHRRYDDEANGREDRYERGEGRRTWREPPAEDRYGPGRSSRRDDSYDERYSIRRHEGVPQPPPIFTRPDDRAYEGRAYEGRAPEARAPEARTYQRRSYEGRYESRSESSSTYESRTESRGEGPCCRAEAAGFDANGFLTWPGKVPARAR